MAWKKKTVPATTANITKAIIAFLYHEGHTASRVNTTGIWDEKRRCFRRSGARVGFYDICATIKTRFKTHLGHHVGLTLMVEVKKGSDELSEEQIEFRKEIIAAGGLCFESKDYNDFVEWYNHVINIYL